MRCGMQAHNVNQGVTSYTKKEAIRIRNTHLGKGICGVHHSGEQGERGSSVVLFAATFQFSCHRIGHECTAVVVEETMVTGLEFS